MKNIINSLLLKYYSWRCHRVAKKQGIIKFSFTTIRQIDDFGKWDGHGWKEWREFLKCLKRDKSKDKPVSDKEWI